MYRYIVYMRGAKNRQLDFQLSFSQFYKIVQDKCYYCSEPLDNDKINGIDRVNSKKGYFIDNIVPCCTICNRMKWNFSFEEFKTQIDKLYKNLFP